MDSSLINSRDFINLTVRELVNVHRKLRCLKIGKGGMKLWVTGRIHASYAHHNRKLPGRDLIFKCPYNRTQVYRW